MEDANTRNVVIDGDRIVICSGASYCYFALSILLFSVGTVITILALDENDGVFANLTHMWLVGPLFISSGLMVAVKTILYLRKETMIMFLTRQRSLLREFHYPGLDISRSCSNLTRPPSYDTVIGNHAQMTRLMLDQDLHDTSSSNEVSILAASTPVSCIMENPPPSYEEALLLNQSVQDESSPQIR